MHLDAMQSSHRHFVNAMGLCWISLMWLTDNLWAVRIRTPPFLTALTPAGWYRAQRGRWYKTTTGWTRQMLSSAGAYMLRSIPRHPGDRNSVHRTRR